MSDQSEPQNSNQLDPQIRTLFERVRMTSTPLVAIRTPDVPATTAALIDVVKAESGKPPIITWNLAAGMQPVGKEAVRFLGSQGHGGRTAQLGVALSHILTLDRTPEVLLILQNPHLSYMRTDMTAVQALVNLRDKAKEESMTIVMLIPDGVPLPREIATDVMVMTEALPDPDALEALVLENYNQTVTVDGKKLKPPKQPVLDRSVAALRGLARFPAEQAVAMSMEKDGISVTSLWDRKVATLEAINGLTVHRGKERFDDLAGLDQLRRFGEMLVDDVRLVVLLDEIEKQLTPDAIDSGASRGQFGQVLSFMEDKGVDGLMLAGHPGNGKSHFAKAIANEAQCLCLAVNWGLAKGRFVGETEAGTALILRTIESITPKGVLFVATSNDVSRLPPELLARFTLGTFMTELPTPEAMKQIWQKRCAEFGVELGDLQVDTRDWSGRDARNACRMARRLGKTVADVADYIIPAAQQDYDSVLELRRQADGRWLDASVKGVYRKDRVNERSDLPRGRRVRVAEGVTMPDGTFPAHGPQTVN